MGGARWEVKVIDKGLGDEILLAVLVKNYHGQLILKRSAVKKSVGEGEEVSLVMKSNEGSAAVGFARGMI
jgi:hypothetical protein